MSYVDSHTIGKCKVKKDFFLWTPPTHRYGGEHFSLCVVTFIYVEMSCLFRKT